MLATVIHYILTSAIHVLRVYIKATAVLRSPTLPIPCMIRIFIAIGVTWMQRKIMLFCGIDHLFDIYSA